VHVGDGLGDAVTVTDGPGPGVSSGATDGTAVSGTTDARGATNGVGVGASAIPGGGHSGASTSAGPAPGSCFGTADEGTL
jgi:hypothetical protein